VVKIEVFDINGRIVDTIVNGNLSPGTYEAVWLAANYSSGTYFYRMSVYSAAEKESKTLHKKMMLIK
jgi:hypothetical protein